MHAMPEPDARAMLSASHLGVLSLADKGTAYAVPLYFAFDGEAVYFQCHPGAKDAFIRSTAEACLVVSHVESKHIWESVQVFGPVHVLALSNDLDKAKSALAGTPFPPLEGNYPGGMPKRSEERVFYLRLTPKRVSGKASTFRAPAA